MTSHHKTITPMRAFYNLLTVLALAFLATPALAQLSVSFNVTPPTCGNYNNGLVQATATGGTPTFYAWSTGQSGPTTAGLSGGTYTVTVSYSDGQSTTAAVAVVAPPILMASIVAGGDTCSPDGSATAVVTGGTGQITYNWINSGATVATVFQPLQHSECVTVSDANGCSVTTCSKIFKPFAGVLNVLQNADCATQQGGAVIPIMSGGYGPYTFQWSNGTNLSFLSNAQPGNYAVTVTDFNGCSVTLNNTVLGENSAITVATSSLGACPLNASGSASATASNGLSPYTYAWSNGSNGAAISALSAGTYTVTATDNFGCTNTADVVVNPSSLAVAVNILSQPVCATANGSMVAMSSGGSSDNTYLWSNGATSAVVSNLLAGTYTVTVTDFLGCTNTSVVVLESINTVLQVVLTPSPTSCGLSDGAITSVVGNGTAPFSYNWSNGAESANIGFLVAGSYALTVIDANGCVGSAVTEVSDSEQLVFGINVVPTGCLEINSGAASITGLTGTAPFVISWSTGATGESLTGLGAGIYAVSVTDAAGCAAQTNFGIGTAPALELEIIGQNALCGIDNGTVTINVVGGIFPWNYLWSNGETTQSITNLAAGAYSVTVSDAVGCTAVAATQITQPASFEVVVETVDASCIFPNGGSATVTVTNGGVAPFTYNWSIDSLTGNVVTGLTAGTYTVTIVDINGCVAIEEMVINGGSVVEVSFTDVTNQNACLNLNGTATVVANGGLAPYTFVSTALLGFNGDQFSVPAGSYAVTATDANGCTGVGTVVIGLNEGIVDVAIVSPSTTLDCNTFSIPVLATGGISYVWNFGSINDTITISQAGTYTVTATGLDGCTGTASIVITQLENTPEISIAASTPNQINCANGEVTLTATTNGDFDFLWSDNTTTGNSLVVTSAGIYGVTVTDVVTGCSNSATYTVVSNLDQPQVSATASTIGCGNSFSLLQATSTTADATFVWDNGTIGPFWSTSNVGTYTVTATNPANGCTNQATVTILTDTITPVLVVEAPNGNALTCLVNSLTFVATGAVSYAWSTGAATDSITISTPGVYNVTATGSNGCTSVGTVVVELIDGVEVTIVSPGTVLDCNTFTIPVQAVGAESYVWNFGSINDTITISEAGTYTVTATGLDGCTGTASIVITQLDNAPQISVSGSIPNQITCTNGEVTLTATTNGDFGLLWSDNTTTGNTLVVNSGGIYNVTVTDPVTGCSNDIAYTVDTNLEQPQVAATASIIGCGDEFSLLQATSTTADATFVWDNGTIGPFWSTSNVGTYTVTATNPANGCTNQASVTVLLDTIAPVVVVEAPNGNALTCLVNSLTFIATGGDTYVWSNGADTDTVSINTPGAYVVTTTGINGCTSTANFTVEQTSVAVVAAIESSNVLSCLITSTTLQASGGDNYVWSTEALTSSIVVGAGTYTVTVSNADGCTGTADITIAPATPPSVNVVVLSSNSSINCIFNTVALQAQTDISGATFVWNTGVTAIDQLATAVGVYTVTITDPNTGCTNTAQYEVFEDVTPPAGSISPENPTINCTNEGPVTLTASGGVFYNWSNESLENSITVNPLSTTSYTVTVVGNNGCSATVTTLVIVDTTPPVADIAAPQTTVNCTDPSAALTASAAGIGGAYAWSNNTTNAVNNVSPLVNTTYTVTVTSSNGCTATESVLIIADLVLPTVNIAAPATITCANPGPVTLTATGTNANYNWSQDGTGSSISVTPATTTNYTVTATSSNGCTATAQQSVVVNNTPPSVVVSPNTGTITCNTPGPVVLTAAGATSYDWDPTGESTNVISVNPTSTSTYTVTGTGSNGCTATAESVVTVNLAGPAITATSTPATINPGGASEVEVTAVAEGTYAWSPAAGLSNTNTASPTATPLETTTYVVTVTDGNGCTSTASTLVTVLNPKCESPDLFVPNAFSPNADGENDVFRIRGTNMLEIKLTVYNRWGEQVYSESVKGVVPVQLVGWNGMFKGDKVAPDVYGFSVEVVCTGGETYIEHGNVTVFR